MPTNSNQDNNQSNKSNQPERVSISKGFNWTALVGQVIKGNLIRGAGGKFANKSELANLQNKILRNTYRRLKEILARKKIKEAKAEAKRQASAAKKAAKSKAAKRAAKKSTAKESADKKKAKNREKIFAKVAERNAFGVTLSDLNALLTIPNPNLDRSTLNRLAQFGLVKIDEDGNATLTTSAKGLIRSSEQGKSGPAIERLIEAKSRVDKAKERISDKQIQITEKQTNIDEAQEDLRIAGDELKVLQQELAGQTPGSIKYEKARIKVQKMLARIQKLKNNIVDYQLDIREITEDIVNLQEAHGIEDNSVSLGSGLQVNQTTDQSQSQSQSNTSNQSSNSNQGVTANQSSQAISTQSTNQPQSSYDGIYAVQTDYLGKSSNLSKSEYEFQSTQFNLPSNLTRSIQAQIDPLDLSDEKGLELEPHITILYGLDNQVTQSQILMIAGLFEPFKIKILDLSVFEIDNAEVLKLDVESPEIRKLERLLRYLPHHNERSWYHPHLTIAYLKPGTSWKYLDGKVRNELINTEYEVDTIMFSDCEGNKIPVKLGIEKELPPLYRITPTQDNCKNCLYIDNRLCELYDYEVQLDFTCESFIDRRLEKSLVAKWEPTSVEDLEIIESILNEVRAN